MAAAANATTTRIGTQLGRLELMFMSMVRSPKMTWSSASTSRQAFRATRASRKSGVRKMVRPPCLPLEALLMTWMASPDGIAGSSGDDWERCPECQFLASSLSDLAGWARMG